MFFSSRSKFSALPLLHGPIRATMTIRLSGSGNDGTSAYGKYPIIVIVPGIPSSLSRKPTFATCRQTRSPA